MHAVSEEEMRWTDSDAACAGRQERCRNAKEVAERDEEMREKCREICRNAAEGDAA
jgi:hypothetical protein